MIALDQVTAIATRARSTRAASDADQRLGLVLGVVRVLDRQGRQIEHAAGGRRTLQGAHAAIGLGQGPAPIRPPKRSGIAHSSWTVPPKDEGVINRHD